MEKSTMLAEMEQYVLDLFHDDCTGHDFQHMQRVALMARELALQEQADPFIAEAAGWLHDVGDKKLFKDPEQAKNELNTFLLNMPIDSKEKDRIYQAMKHTSFKAGHQVPETLEGKIVQDADRLDALGAVGIARTFAFGGARNQMIYKEEGGQTSIQHFYDKLFRLKDLINTDSAKAIAEERHLFMEEFVNQLLREWNVEK